MFTKKIVCFHSDLEGNEKHMCRYVGTYQLLYAYHYG